MYVYSYVWCSILDHSYLSNHFEYYLYTCSIQIKAGN